MNERPKVSRIAGLLAAMAGLSTSMRGMAEEGEALASSMIAAAPQFNGRQVQGFFAPLWLRTGKTRRNFADGGKS